MSGLWTPNRVKIGVDCDGVLVDLVTPYAEIYSAISGKVCLPEDVIYWSFSRVWGGGDDLHNRLVDYLVEETPFLRNLRPEKGARNALNILRQYFELHLVTARKLSGVEDTLYSMQRHYPGVFVDHHFTGAYQTAKDCKTSKGVLCKSEGIDVLIDDSFSHVISAVHNGIEGILLTKRWSEYSDETFESLPDDERNRLFVCDTWEGVVRHLLDRYI